MAEKILVGDEELRPSWTIEGTTGYGFLNFLNGLFVDSSRKRALLRALPPFQRLVPVLRRFGLPEQTY